MSTIDNGHLEVGDGGEEGAEKASFVNGRVKVSQRAAQNVATLGLG